MLQPFAWEEVLDMIARMPTCEEKSELAGSWIYSVMCIIRDEEIGIKKILNRDMAPEDLNDIFENTGYAACRKCNKVVEDDHSHLWESNG